MGGNFLFGMLGNLLATPLTRLLKKRYALVSAIAQGAWGATIIILGLQTSMIPAAIIFWLSYLNLGVINSPHNTLLNNAIPSKQRSAMLSIASFASYIGGMIGGVLLGYIAQNASINRAWIIAGIVLVVSLELYRRIDIRRGETHVSMTELQPETQL
jgi:MFS family permease